MAKIVGIIGSGHGKLGNTVLAVRRGVQIARVYQPVVNNPKSARQELSRAKMSLAVKSLRPMKRFINMGWQKSNPSYQFQQAVAQAIPVGNNIITGGAGTELFFDPETCMPCLSNGTLSKPITADLDFTMANLVRFKAVGSESDHFTPSGTPIKLGLVACVYNDAVGIAITGTFTEGEAGNFSAEIIVPENWSGMEVYVYCFTKQLPEGINGLATIRTPWRFPSEVSPTALVGTGTIS